MGSRLAAINKIIPASAVDGPGNRTAVFFQGCNFDCAYCHNPETIRLCSHCGDCLAVCPAQALSLADDRVRWDAAACVGCDGCLAACRHLSTPKTRLMSVAEVLDEIRASLPFIRGVTFSGGECSLQRDFLVELLPKVQALGLTAMLDTNGSYDFSADEELLRCTDGVMLDIKAFDTDAHRRLTGADNTTVLNNAVFLAERGKLYEVRTVVVPDLLPNEQTVRAVAGLLAPYTEQHPIRYKLIKFRPIGVRPAHAGYSVPDEHLMQRLRQLALQQGFIDVVIV